MVVESLWASTMIEISNFYDLVRRAEEGDFTAQCQLADRYSRGDGVPRNYVEAEKWYRPGAELGRSEAQYGLGCLYLDAFGNRVDGIRLLELAGKQGDRGAC